MQFGYDEKQKKYIIQAAGQGVIAMTIEEVNQFLEFIQKHAENETKETK